jgi:hypothetical protein
MTDLRCQLAALLAALSVVLSAVSVQAQNSTQGQNQAGSRAQPKYAYQAKTVQPDVEVYEKPDFGSTVIATLPEGKVFDVSRTVKNSFYKIRIKSGVLGYVFDGDLQPLFANAPIPHQRSGKKKRTQQEGSKKRRSFEYTQFAGLQFQNIQFEEDTMGSKRREALSFFGAKISGPNLIIEGATPSEMNFLFHTGAPSYYEKATGKQADGWVLIGDFLLQTYFPQSKNTLTFLGFGPMFRYSKFAVTVTDATTNKTSDYSLEDIAVGVVFNVGAAVRLNSIALRGDLSYFWEKQAYFGGGLSVQFAF